MPQNKQPGQSARPKNQATQRPVQRQQQVRSQAQGNWSPQQSIDQLSTMPGAGGMQPSGPTNTGRGDPRSQMNPAGNMRGWAGRQLMQRPTPPPPDPLMGMQPGPGNPFDPGNQITRPEIQPLDFAQRTNPELPMDRMYRPQPEEMPIMNRGPMTRPGINMARGLGPSQRPVSAATEMYRQRRQPGGVKFGQQG